jgi:hypothetical protein
MVGLDAGLATLLRISRARLPIFAADFEDHA